MAQASTKPTDFNRALGDAKKQASGVADAFTDAAEDVYGQARESAADVFDTAHTAARKTAGSFEQAIRNTIETQPYTAAAIALGIGWLLGPHAPAALSLSRRRTLSGVMRSGRGKLRPDFFVTAKTCRSRRFHPVAPSIATNQAEALRSPQVASYTGQQSGEGKHGHAAQG